MALQDRWPEETAPAFSLVAGGPFYGLRLRLRLLSPPLEDLWRLTAALTAIAWLPPLVFAAVGAGRPGIRSFLHDGEAQVRFLLCLPILIYAERFVHERLRLVPERFLARGLVPAEERPSFEAAFAEARRLRDGPAELALLGLIYALRASPWDVTLTPPGRGWYYLWVSIPLYQFLLARWVWRLVIWIRLLSRLARLRLRLLPAHPDKAGGLGFLTVAVVAFEPLLFSQSALFAAFLTENSARASTSVWPYDKDIAAIFVAGILVILGPLCFFALPMAKARLRSWRDYGDLFSRCVRAFERRWMDGEAKELPSSGDLQGQASLGASYDPIDRMRPVPFGLEPMARVAVWAALPWLPAALAAGRALEVFKLLFKVLW